jgi:MHS family proline/betaine transporter-like MFS transporter
MKPIKKVITATVIGSTLEWYEFSVFAQLSVVISKLFFPQGDELLSLVNTFGIFALGFIVRPIGGLLFGYIGDKYGRKRGLVFSMLFMSIPTFCMGFLPTYATAGILAPILLASLRLFQGLSIGGENGGAYTFAAEHVPTTRIFRAAGAIQASVCLGVLLGSLSVYTISHSMSQASFEEWGWRVPFYFSIVLGVIGLFIRYYLNETPAYQEIKQNNRISKNPIKEVFAQPLSILIAVGLVLSMVIPFFTLSVFIQSYMNKILHFPLEVIMKYNSISLGIAMIMSIVSGFLSDRFGYRLILISSASLLIIWAYPMVWLLNNAANFNYAIIAQQVFAAIVGLYTGTVIAVVVNLFPTNIRYTGVTLSMNISSSIFGGTVPLLAFWLIGNYGQEQGLMLFGAYIASAAGVSLIALLSLAIKSPVHSIPSSSRSHLL